MNRNVAGCCDGRGQVHHGEDALHFVTLCKNYECLARRERAWARECEPNDLVAAAPAERPDPLLPRAHPRDQRTAVATRNLQGSTQENAA